MNERKKLNFSIESMKQRTTGKKWVNKNPPTEDEHPLLLLLSSCLISDSVSWESVSWFCISDSNLEILKILKHLREINKLENNKFIRSDEMIFIYYQSWKELNTNSTIYYILSFDITCRKKIYFIVMYFYERHYNDLYCFIIIDINFHFIWKKFSSLMVSKNIFCWETNNDILVFNTLSKFKQSIKS